MTLQGPEDRQVVLYAEQLAELLACNTERLEEARTILLEVLEVSMVSVTLLCCRECDPPVLPCAADEPKRPWWQLKLHPSRSGISLQPSWCLVLVLEHSDGYCCTKLTLAAVSPSAWHADIVSDLGAKHAKHGSCCNPFQEVHLTSTQSSLPYNPGSG